jgi:hypothetical protein
MGWQPIETAPKDGTWILSADAGDERLVTRHGFTIVQWCDSWRDEEGYKWEPTCWQPLPEPPAH